VNFRPAMKMAFPPGHRWAAAHGTFDHLRLVVLDHGHSSCFHAGVNVGYEPRASKVYACV
jgi:hypothetical protein